VRKTAFAALWALAAWAVRAQSPPVLFEQPLSPRNANYTIEVTLDAQKHLLKGKERILWRNITGAPASEAWFHLYLNAFANDQSVFVKESGGQLRGDKFDKKNWGYCQVLSLGIAREGGIVPLVQEFPKEDRTTMRVLLPEAVPPGGEAEFEVTFESQLPKVFARAGFAGEFNMAGQWFPKLGVFQGGRGWNCHTYHANSEFFSDFGVYDVSVTVPVSYVVGATGILWREVRKGESKTLDFHAEDVHDFGWTASPAFVEKTETFDGIKVRVLMQPGNRNQIPRYMAAAKKTIECYAKWIWNYPYPQMTIVDPPMNGMGAAGMEYPMLITAGASPFFPASLLLPEMVVVHEFGHNWWYGMEANNEFEEAWLDEGINSYYETRIMDDWFGVHDSMVRGLLGWHAGDVTQQRIQYLAVPDLDPVVQDSWKYASNGSYGAMSYSKSVMILKTLEGLLGQRKMDEVMRAFFMEVKFTHPTTEDFLRIVSRAAGQDLDPVLRPMLFGTGTVDFKVARVRSVLRSGPMGLDITKTPPEPFAAEKAAKGVAAKAGEKGKGAGDGAGKGEKGSKEPPQYDSKVVIQRKGELVLPVDVLVTFSDKSTKLEHWDGQGRYVTFAYTGPKVARVVIDPDGKVPIDLSLLNNGWMSTPDHAPAASLSLRMRVVFQGLMAVLANVL
jgi:hypothetical protein